nr:BLUF domain-containing protein [Kineosporia mesophila]
MMYASQAVVDLNEREMEALLGVSRARNQEAGITGMLLHVHDVPAQEAFFVQILEGDQEAIEQTFARIQTDELHTRVTVVHRAVAAQHSFPDWQMGLATMDMTVAVDLARHHPQAGQAGQAGPAGPAGAARSSLEMLSNAFLARIMLTLGARELRQHNRSETAGVIQHADAQTLPATPTPAFFWRGPDGSPLPG